MMRRSILRTLLFAVSLCAGGCTNAHHVDVMTVLTRGHCDSAKTGVHLIDFATLATFRGTHLIGMTESHETTTHPAHLIAIVPAQYPTAGYRVNLLDGTALTDKRLTINVAIERPPDGAMLAQMITQPCLVVGIADPAVSRVRVMHEAEVLGEVELPSAE